MDSGRKGSSGSPVNANKRTQKAEAGPELCCEDNNCTNMSQLMHDSASEHFNLHSGS